ncbi:AAA family ATPase [Clostridium gasigenes]|uniref:AAA family ATPase n=1 Tax=Clostridium gasigenes TaxID=94869 RepID=UPI001C0D065D|nr:AAA family ATPase [Clostridium gasigenes]MBU3133103.1 AAA family ATPase [Clostridium gasigenes]
MKLIYLWVKNCRDFILDQKLSFSSEYDVDFNSLDTINIVENKEYIKYFYGENVSEISAIVGKNGTGKTTVARMIHSRCDGAHPFGDIIRKYNEDNGDINSDYSKEVQVYVDNYLDKEGKERKKIIIYYFLGKGTELQVSYNNIKYSEYGKVDRPNIERINLDGLKNEVNGNDNLSMAEEKHKTTVVYITNTFDINDIHSERGLCDITTYGKDKSISFSPMYNLKKAKSEHKNLYGAAKPGIVLSSIINEYAEKMNLDYFDAYRKYQAYDLLLSFKKAPVGITDKLDIFKEFKIKIKTFGEYTENDPQIGAVDNFVGNRVHIIRQHVLKSLYKNIKFENIAKIIYINILCEVLLFLNVWDYTEDFEMLKKENKIAMDDKRTFELVLNKTKELDKSKIKVVELIEEAICLKSMDILILTRFKEVIDDNTDYKMLLSTEWYKQFIEYIDIFEVNKKLQLADKVNFKNNNVVAFLLEEFNKDSSIYKRMLNIEPVVASTGETALVNIFASIYKTIELRPVAKSIILILDELDVYLHPRWQQQILKEITNWINTDFKDKKIQLIITSHSPIILSDITADRVIKLNRDHNNCIISKCDEKTFGANVGTLFYDSFFMKEGSIGDIAKDKIQEVIKYTRGEENSIKTYEEAKYLIENIGEPIVKAKLSADLEKMNIKKSLKADEIQNLISKMTFEEKTELLKSLKLKCGDRCND